MNYADLIQKVAEATDMPKVAATRAVEATVEAIINALKAGEEVRVAGLGIFDAVTRQARPGRNPQTGATIEIPASTILRFRAGKAAKDELNPAAKAKKTAA